MTLSCFRRYSRSLGLMKSVLVTGHTVLRLYLGAFLLLASYNLPHVSDTSGLTMSMWKIVL